MSRTLLLLRPSKQFSDRRIGGSCAVHSLSALSVTYSLSPCCLLQRLISNAAPVLLFKRTCYAVPIANQKVLVAIDCIRRLAPVSLPLHSVMYPPGTFERTLSTCTHIQCPVCSMLSSSYHSHGLPLGNLYAGLSFFSSSAVKTCVQASQKAWQVADI